MARDYEAVARKVDAIEAEMKRIGAWQAQPLPAGRLDFEQAFGADKLAFEQWLQFVLVPRVRDIVATRGDFPQGSEVATQAFREWKMFGERDDVDRLLELLREFDAMFE
jgi:uncharacterized protein YqcC (DUF446 family)